MRFFVRALSPVLLAAVIVAFVGAPAANAVPNAHSARFVGTYTVYLTRSGEPGVITGMLTTNADGSAHDQNNNLATWSNRGRIFTLLFSEKGLRQVFIAKRTKQGLGTKKQPGVYSNNGSPGGTWWAVKTS